MLLVRSTAAGREGEQRLCTSCESQRGVCLSALWKAIHDDRSCLDRSAIRSGGSKATAHVARGSGMYKVSEDERSSQGAPRSCFGGATRCTILLQHAKHDPRAECQLDTSFSNVRRSGFPRISCLPSSHQPECMQDECAAGAGMGYPSLLGEATSGSDSATKFLCGGDPEQRADACASRPDQFQCKVLSTRTKQGNEGRSVSAKPFQRMGSRYPSDREETG
mmetsp:Transcript_9064/g.13239  ORF Transcript_9064/g.13239 Transcript_9064/m.13239 type:complete len:221 (-) Transcript_9064:440-1102(-)